MPSLRDSSTSQPTQHSRAGSIIAPLIGTFKLAFITDDRRQRTFQSSISQSTCEHLLLSPDCAGRRAPILLFRLEELSKHMSEISLPVLRRLQGVRDILVPRWLRGGELLLRSA